MFMEPLFCKVGKVRPGLGVALGLNELEKKYLSFINYLTTLLTP